MNAAHLSHLRSPPVRTDESGVTHTSDSSRIVSTAFDASRLLVTPLEVINYRPGRGLRLPVPYRGVYKVSAIVDPS